MTAGARRRAEWVAARGLAAVLAFGVVGCARYVPRPIEPSVHAAVYRARRLDDTALIAWVERYGRPPEPVRWSARQLGLAALATRAELVRARAEWLAAQQGERRAGARPQPGVQADVERAVSGNGDQSPWVVSLAGLLSVELGGKRGARLLQARAHTAVVEADLRATAWGIVIGAHEAAIRLAAATEDLDLARRQATALGGVASLEQTRFEEGSLTSAELARTRAEVQEARFEANAAEAVVLEARASLAGVLAMPAQSLDSVVVVDTADSRCVTAGTLNSDSLATLALGHRSEIARAMADYALAEADLRLEVARRFPDLDLGPGFTWDQGVHRWTLALALPNLLGFRNHAAIDELTAARAAAAAHVAEVQDDLLADVDLAVARCRGATLERLAADSQAAAAERTAELAKAAYDRGETSRLEPALADLAIVRAARARRSAERRLLTAGGMLDRALGQWSGDPSERWPDPREPGLTGAESEAESEGASK